jgi:hypothetical protein
MHRFTASDTNADTSLDINVLAAQIAEYGIELADAAGRLDAFVRAARCAGASSTLIALVADPAEPAVARERAFGLLAVAIAADRSSPRRRAAA